MSGPIFIYFFFCPVVGAEDCQGGICDRSIAPSETEGLQECSVTRFDV